MEKQTALSKKIITMGSEKICLIFRNTVWKILVLHFMVSLYLIDLFFLKESVISIMRFFAHCPPQFLPQRLPFSQYWRIGISS